MVAKETTTAKKAGNREKVMELVEKMTVLELADLVKDLEEKFGVTAQAPVLQAAVAPAGAAEAQPKEEQTEFTIVLTSFGDKKLQVIKEVRALTNLGLKEAKDLVDNAPKPIKEKVSKEEAESIKKRLIDVGATVELE
ncbi:50S ribosomal protein L7/L12 [candidate division TA06 bacterium]|uniref:Large ribosomal subunit protein bL12 n=1 Tax=candidate division TA06 bacterium TaxID=2250710 RepID=A0A523XQE2_UNCT6|nr:MAG: 50S ribosomal protein L7/L12 [candidate division TA06 bacterium]